MFGRLNGEWDGSGRVVGGCDDGTVALQEELKGGERG